MSIPGTTPSPGKIYPGSADDDSKTVFDMSVNDTSVYGTFSVGEPVVSEGVDPQIEYTPESEVAASLVEQVVNEVNIQINDVVGDFLNEEGDQLDGGVF